MNYNSTATTLPNYWGTNDFFPVFRAKENREPLLTWAYHELLYAYLERVPNVIFLLTIDLREKLFELGSQEFSSFIFDRLKNKLKGINKL